MTQEQKQISSSRPSGGKHSLLWLSIAALLIIFIDAAIDYIRFFELAYYDSAPEFVLGKLLAEEGGVLTTSWIYSTELRVLNTQLVNSLLFRFLSDWRVVQAVSVFIHLLLLAGAALLYLKQLPGRGYMWGALVFLLPFSMIYVHYVLAGEFYIPHFIIIFLALACRLRAHDGAGSRWLFPFELLLAFGAGLGGIRQLEITYVPLLLAVVFLACAARRGGGTSRTGFRWKEPVPAFLLLVSACAGYLVNDRILSHVYTFMDYGSVRFGIPDLTRLIKTAYSVLENFGFTPRTTLLSLNTCKDILVLCAGVTIFLLICGSLKRLMTFSYGEKLTLLFTAFSWAINLFVLLFTDVFEPRYCLPQMVVTVVSVFILVKHSKHGHRRAAALVLLSCLAVNSVYGYREWVKLDKNSAELRETAAYLQEEGFHYGYGAFYTCAALPQLTNGEVDICCVQDFDGLVPLQWLMKSELLTNTDDQSRTFLLMTQKEYENSAGLAYIQQGHVGFENEDFIVIVYENNQTLRALAAKTRAG